MCIIIIARPAAGSRDSSRRLATASRSATTDWRTRGAGKKQFDANQRDGAIASRDKWLSRAYRVQDAIDCAPIGCASFLMRTGFVLCVCVSGLILSNIINIRINFLFTLQSDIIFNHIFRHIYRYEKRWVVCFGLRVFLYWSSSASTAYIYVCKHPIYF